MICSPITERADNNQAGVVRNTAIYDRGIVKCRCEGRDGAAATRACRAPGQRILHRDTHVEKTSEELDQAASRFDNHCFNAG
jgi:hypothetical protein